MKRLISIIILTQLAFLYADNYSLSFDGDDDYVSLTNDYQFSGADDFTIGTGTGTGDFIVGNTNSDMEKNNKGFSDRGRQVIFEWSLGLGILVGLFIYLLLLLLV